MRSPLGRYVAWAYLKYYVALVLTAAALAGRTITSANIAYVALMPLSCIATLALCCAVVEFGRRREFETFQSYGVSLRRFAIPLAAAPFGIQVAASVLAVGISDNRAGAALYAVLSLAGIFGSFAAIVAFVWRELDKNVVKACALGCAAQAGFAGLAAATVFF